MLGGNLTGSCSYRPAPVWVEPPPSRLERFRIEGNGDILRSCNSIISASVVEPGKGELVLLPAGQYAHVSVVLIIVYTVSRRQDVEPMMTLETSFISFCKRCSDDSFVVPILLLALLLGPGSPISVIDCGILQQRSEHKYEAHHQIDYYLCVEFVCGIRRIITVSLRDGRSYLKKGLMLEGFIVLATVLACTGGRENYAFDGEALRNSSRYAAAAAVATRGIIINDVVSKNITMVLENLLMNYENNQLPTHGKGTPTVVKTNILIRSMGPVSELDMDYSMDCYFRQSWRDPRLSFLGPIKSLSLSIKMLERIWRPDTYFYNGKHSYVHTITVPNKLLRISQDGDILYSMRLTIKAKCPMELRNFPMDRQSCPLILGSYAYTSGHLVYEWQDSSSVNFVPGMALSQFDLMGSPCRNLTFVRREGEFSVLQVSFNLQRHTGYFLIQVYVPCVLIVVLSWVSFWIHREATSDRVGLGITTVLTLSTISLDSRTDLPKVRYATALDWFLLMSFGYCIATLLEFAGVHYFTKVGSGEIPLDEEDLTEEFETDTVGAAATGNNGYDENDLCSFVPCSSLETVHIPEIETTMDLERRRRRGSMTVSSVISKPSTMERQTQTDVWIPKWRQFIHCLIGDEEFRRRRQREAAGNCKKQGENIARHINSVSSIDRVARVVFPASFGLLNVLYWVIYVSYQEDFKWQDPLTLGSISKSIN